jgi:hypothetical protein
MENGLGDYTFSGPSFKRIEPRRHLKYGGTRDDRFARTKDDRGQTQRIKRQAKIAKKNAKICLFICRRSSGR